MVDVYHRRSTVCTQEVVAWLLCERKDIDSRGLGARRLRVSRGGSISLGSALISHGKTRRGIVLAMRHGPGSSGEYGYA